MVVRVSITLDAANRAIPLAISDYAQWHRVFDVIVDGAYYCARAAAHAMIARQGWSYR
jgi:NAD(P)-dependent dehydrogenase (short-subunit alcohol dehydrogenase family)